MAKDHGPSVKDDKQYEGLRKKGMSKSRAAAIANSPGASSKGGKSSGSAQSSRGSGSGGNQSQKKAAGRKGGKKSIKKRWRWLVAITSGEYGGNRFVHKNLRHSTADISAPSSYDGARDLCGGR